MICLNNLCSIVIHKALAALVDGKLQLAYLLQQQVQCWSLSTHTQVESKHVGQTKSIRFSI
jgi:hypothetical protein